MSFLVDELYEKSEEIKLTCFAKSLVIIFILLNQSMSQAETPEQHALDAVQKNYETVFTYEAEFIQKS